MNDDPGSARAHDCRYVWRPTRATGGRRAAGQGPCRPSVCVGIPPPGDAMYRALLDGLHELGYAEGKHLHVAYRWGDPQRFPEFASELVRLPAAVIVTFGTPAALAAKHATTTVPIVMALVGDPVRSGIVAGLAHPGGNITGVTNQAPEMVPKRLELLKEAVPHASRVAFLWNPANEDQVAHFEEAEAGAQAWAVRSIPWRCGAVRSWRARWPQCGYPPKPGQVVVDRVL